MSSGSGISTRSPAHELEEEAEEKEEEEEEGGCMVRRVFDSSSSMYLPSQENDHARRAAQCRLVSSPFAGLCLSKMISLFILQSYEYFTIRMSILQ